MKAKKIQIPSKIQAEKIIRLHLSDGFVVITSHFKKRLAERGFSMQDVTHVLKSGRIYSEPEIDINSGKPRYRMEGETLDEEVLKVIAELYDEKTILITAFGD